MNRFWVIFVIGLLSFLDAGAQTPEDEGLHSATLDSLVRFITDTRQNIHHLAIIRNNVEIVKTDFYPYSSAYLHDVASVTKSITALLVGIAIDKGYIKNEQQKAISFFPEINVKNAQRTAAVTIKDLLTMTSGWECSVEGGEKALSEMRTQKDWAAYMFNLPFRSVPGKNFSYCSGNYYLLGEILYRASGLTPHQFARKYLLKPLGISQSHWLANDKGIEHGWGDLFLLPADMTKIGVMVLQKGRWKNKRIISREWITKSLTAYSYPSADRSYGYGWWIGEKNGFCEAAGRGRQTISIIAEKQMVVVMTGGEFDAATVGNYIFRAISTKKKLPRRWKDYQALQQSLIAAKESPGTTEDTIDIFASNDVIASLNGNTILLEKNITGIDSLQIRFIRKDSGSVEFYRKNVSSRHPFVLSRLRYATSMHPDVQLPVALKAHVTPTEFILHYNELCRINNFFFRFGLRNGTLTLKLTETTNGIDVVIPVQ